MSLEVRQPSAASASTVAVLVERHGSVAVLTLSNPPVNGLGFELRLALRDAIRQAQMAEDVRAIVLHGAGQMFSGGADIRQFGTPKASQSPMLRAVNHTIEASTKPVVAAMHGHALGAGLELAMSCHWRVAEATSLLGLPEVLLGFVPGGGGTQRLPRLVGLERALEMIGSGRRIDASEAFAVGLVDRIANGNLLEGAIALAIEMLDVAPFARVTSQRAASLPGDDVAAIIAAARSGVVADDPNRQARLEVIRCIEAATRLDIDPGLDLERAAFTTLVASDASIRARQAFFATRRSTQRAGPNVAVTPDLKRPGDSA